MSEDYKFKVGDKVKVIKSEYGVINGEKYIIDSIEGNFIYLQGIDRSENGYFPWRFELIKPVEEELPLPNNVKRFILIV